MMGRIFSALLPLPPTGYDVVRVALGGLLILAAGLKGHELATEPTAGTWLLESRWFLAGVVEFELLFGLSLWANVWPKATWAVALACFGLFACVSFYEAVSGYDTCGCFGRRVPIHPGYTALLDLTIVFSLLLWRPKREGPFFVFGLRQLPLRSVAAVLIVWMSIGVPAAVAMVSYQDTTISDAGEIIGNGKVVVLKPESWVGKRFPLLEYVEISDRLAEGDWLVLLYHQDCPLCQNVIRQLTELAEADQHRIALVQMPPYRISKSLPQAVARFTCVRLADKRDWFAETPVWLNIRDGRVLDVFRNRLLVPSADVSVRTALLKGPR